MGRTEPGDYAAGWTPPSYTVDEHGKVRGGYEPHEPNNWGRWGDDDQVGTQNLVGPEQIVAAARLVTEGKMFSLALDIDASGPRFPTRPAPLHWFIMAGSDAIVGSPAQAEVSGYQWNDDMLQMPLQGSTQWDGFGHFCAEDSMYNGYWAGDVTAAAGARNLGMEHMRTAFVGRCVLLDLARARGVDCLPDMAEIGRAEIEACVEAQGSEIHSGDIVLLRTGYLNKWWGIEGEAAKMEYFYASPGLAESSVGWLHDNGISAAASDTIAVEVLQPTEEQSRILPVHHSCLIDLGLTLGEFWVLDELADDCAADGRYEFMLASQPLVIPGAVGSPINPIALK